MTLTPYDRLIRRTVRISALWGMLALIGAAAFFGLIVGVQRARIKPHIVSIDIVSPHQPAGTFFTVNEHAMLPPDCIPRTRRWIEFHLQAGQERPDLQLLPDEAMPDYGPQIIPIPLSAKVGCGRFLEQKTTQGCGFLNGVLEPLSTTSQPVDVCILPPRVQLTPTPPT